MRPPQPVIVTDLFPELLDELLALLSSLSDQDWQKPTACTGWSVKDVALHMLGGEIGNLSWRRDGYTIESEASITGWEELVAYLNRWNQDWVQSARRISTRLLIDLLGHTGTQLNALFSSLDPFAVGSPVSWVGPEPAPVWLDLAREYTERWHHQQHIRDAVDRPGMKTPRYQSPALEAFVWAMPRAFQEAEAPEDTTVTLSITGPSGGRWSVRKEGIGWKLYSGAPAHPEAEAMVDEDNAWRLFTRGLNPRAAREAVGFTGDRVLGEYVLEMVSIIA
ncbi:MAG: maleylpyruvate isomerase family mycothiol-dependent enzyme [Chloroflexi bacterium]|nr:maleylpyruvate isomerase family mycothiol-dependent enzyme [Chloroflexota bacterium]